MNRADPTAPPDPQPEPAATAGRRGRADHKESVRRVILDAARELFVCEGYGNVSLRKIAGRIGYTPMAIYVHFRDKSEILDCICEESFDCFRANSERLDQLGLAPRERLAAGLRFYIDFGLEHPHHYQLTFMTPPCGGQSLGRRKEIGQDCYQRMRRRVALCVAADPLHPPDLPEVTELAESPEVELASQTVWTAVHGLVSLLIARPEFPWLERERLIEAVIESALGALAPAMAGGRLP
ncbi:MAG: TetR/AcrR family transcriptional regulator [Acidobacteria bacterium]|nr:TetR/AcrR family transcriptional regulator [Acidobacteriota bacterium]